VPIARPLTAGAAGNIPGPLSPYFFLEVNDGAKHGNGFMLSMWPDMIVTAAHVVRHAHRVRARSRVGNHEVHLDCTWVASDPDGRPDLALVRLPFPVEPSIHLVSDVAPERGLGTLCAYVDEADWQNKGLLFHSTRFVRKGPWICFRNEADQPTEYGATGASGGAFFDDADPARVIGVYHGSFDTAPAVTEHVAAVFDLGFLMSCRARFPS
jgi:hypothetical protein